MFKIHNAMLLVFMILGVGAVISCSQAEETAQQATDKRLQAEADCASLAKEKTGHNIASQTSTNNNLAKGAAIGAAGGAAVGALSSKKSKKVVQGAALGAAAGAGIAALSDNEKKKAAAKVREAYDHEYQNCLNAKGF